MFLLCYADVARNDRPRTPRSGENIAAEADDIKENSQRDDDTHNLGSTDAHCNKFLWNIWKCSVETAATVHCPVVKINTLCRRWGSKTFDYVNKICVFWGTKDPSTWNTWRAILSQQSAFWCGFYSENLIGTFEVPGGTTVTVTGERYRQMFNEPFLPQISDLEHYWFQQPLITTMKIWTGLPDCQI